jgi:hypothetical protein
MKAVSKGPVGALCCAALLLVTLGASSCGQNNPTGVPQARTCSDAHIKVKSDSLDHKAVYVCDGQHKKVIWKAAGDVKTFTVDFTDWPFTGSKYTIQPPSGSDTAESPEVPAFPDLAVFKYTITITPKTGSVLPLDPHVISGGGL